MKKDIFKKIIRIQISSLLIFTILFTGFFSVYPQKTEAVVFTDPTNLVQNTINAIASVATEAYEYSMKYKEYVLDPLASGFAKQIIQNLTSSIVEWINSGFEGSPSFVQNPGAFFLDIADQATGQFISGDLAYLCSPFSIDLRIALAFTYRPNVQKRYACTLSTIIENAKNAGKNASINGFTAGDFEQGGWPAFISLTTEPQNNIYGAYITAESELSLRVAHMQEQQKDELTQGKGFLSWRKCKKTGVESTAERSNQGTGEGNYNGAERSFEGSGENFSPEEVCEIQTPGSVIAGALETQLGSPVRQLELADEFGEIVNALFSQLGLKVLNGGLYGASQKSNSGGSSYLEEIKTDISKDTTQVDKIRTELVSNIKTYKKNTLEYKQNRDEALNIMITIKNNYDLAKTCYEEKATRGGLTNQIIMMQNLAKEIEVILNTKIAPKSLELLSLAKEADNRMKILQEIQDKANSAKTLNDLNIPSQQYGDLIQNRRLTNAIDIQNSKNDLEKVIEDSKDHKQDALRKLQQCQIM